jgi:hypothetical protein
MNGAKITLNGGDAGQAADKGMPAAARERSAISSAVVSNSAAGTGRERW